MTSNEFFSSEVSQFISEKGHNFYDARLVTSDNQKYPINKVVLAVRSNFFKCLFKRDGTSNIASGKKHLEEFILPSISHQVLEPVLHWVYHNELKVNDLKTVLMILESAEFLALEGMSTVCQDWIKDNIGADNVLGVIKYSENNFLKYMGKKAWDLLMANLPHVAQGEEWLKLEAGQVAKIIARDELLCKEEEVWKASYQVGRAPSENGQGYHQ